jgi:hypothetical protein
VNSGEQFFVVLALAGLLVFLLGWWDGRPR